MPSINLFIFLVFILHIITEKTKNAIFKKKKRQKKAISVFSPLFASPEFFSGLRQVLRFKGRGLDSFEKPNLGLNLRGMNFTQATRQSA